MAQRTAIINGSNLNQDKDFWTFIDILAGGTSMISNGLLVSTNSVAVGKCLIKCTRTSTTPNETVWVVFENTTATTIDTSGTKKVYIEVLQTRINDGTLNTDQWWTGIATITTGASYPAWNYIPLASITWWVITDERPTTKIKWTEIVGVQSLAKWIDIASATTTNLATATGNTVTITGNTTITGFWTVTAWTIFNLIFSWTPILTYNATSLILPWSANITVQAGDTATLVSLGAGNWVCNKYQRASGQSLVSSSVPFGDGSDGSITWALTITWSNNTYIKKQYTTFAPGNNTVTITPTGCILHIQVQWDCNLTGTTFSFSGKWAQWWLWGVWGASWPTFSTGASWTGGLHNLPWLAVLWQGLLANSWTWWALGSAISSNVFNAVSNWWQFNFAWTWGGGGGWAWWQWTSGTTSGSGGNWGNGWWCLILEVWGNIVFSWTVANFNGTNWWVGTAGASAWWWGGGGWWGGGICIIRYNWNASGTLTPNVSGWTGSAGGSGITWTGWWAGWWGSSIVSSGTVWWNNSGSTGGTWGNGGSWAYLIAHT